MLPAYESLTWSVPSDHHLTYQLHASCRIDPAVEALRDLLQLHLHTHLTKSDLRRSLFPLGQTCDLWLQPTQYLVQPVSGKVDEVIACECYQQPLRDRPLERTALRSIPPFDQAARVDAA